MRLPMLVSCVSWSFIALGGPLPGHRLPEGAEQRVREREVDIRKLAIELTVDMRRQRIAGAVDISFIPLLDDIAAVHFDAAGPVVSEVELLSGAANTKLEFRSADRRLRVGLPANAASGEELLVRIHYSAEPDTGLYFFPETPTEPAEAWNFGEGGRHYGWLPLYNDTNDRFAVESRITVVKPYVVLGNGKLLDTRENRNGSRTFHWAQDAPIPNYLLALNIGEFVAVPLRSAKVGDREIPLTVWTQEGNEAAAAYSFQSTSDMVEYFSELFGYDYAWDKYDQVTLRNFSGAMETTTMVGFTPLTLTYEDGLLDNSPQLDFAYPSWTNDDTISHELAHHWFGDLVTCRSLASIWLNESFASYSHTVWAGHANGEDDLTYQRWRYLHRYLDFVHETGTVRPLEYYRYDASDDMYTEEITYLKGALVLHMLRHFLGDEAFYRSLSTYLARHQFGEVESIDLQRALEDVTGRKLDWFFGDWIRGGGYPALAVSWQWAPERESVDLSIEQLQADLPFENQFELPVDVEVVTAAGAKQHTLMLRDQSLAVALPVDGEPLMVNVDKGNWLVADIHEDESEEQVVYQLEHGDVAAALRAARQLAEDFPRRPAAVAALAEVLSGARHWGLRQEAALDLGTMGGDAAQVALVAALEDPDRRIRRAAVIGLGRHGSEQSAAALERVIAGDDAEEVVAVAAVALGRMQAPQAVPVLDSLMKRDARYHDLFRLAALTGLAELEDPALADTFASHVGADFSQEVRLAAIDGWLRAAPHDSRLSPALRTLAADPDNVVRGTALETLGELHRTEDREFLLEYAESAADPNLQKLARDSAETIGGFAPE